MVEGVINPLDLALQIKFIEDVIANFKEKLREEVILELSKYGKDDCSKFNGKFEVREMGVKYDFHDCNDSIYNDLTQKINELIDQRKEREKFLKSLKNSECIVNQSTGEIVTIFPPKKSSTTSYAIKWKD
jgi:PHP family Zn ribbon phosphoesterase